MSKPIEQIEVQPYNERQKISMDTLFHRFEFVMFHPHNPKQVICVEQNTLAYD